VVLPALRAEGLAFAFGGLEVLRSVSFEIQAGLVTAIVGQNGAGKSTLLNLVSGLRRPQQGAIFDGSGRRLDERAPHHRLTMGIARTFQEVRVFLRLTVLENVLLAVGSSAKRRIIDYVRAPARSEARVALDCLDWAGLKSLADQPASVLSFGQQRRMALAQVLASGAEVALLDEPTAGLDPGAVTLVEAKLVELNRNRGMTIILIEHNLPFVRRVAHSVIYLHGGEVARHAPVADVLDDPAFRRGYLGVS
jgi:ABC-type branched-subunit amino acid transport system ATPase component